VEKLKEYYKDIKFCVDNNTNRILSVQINLLNQCYQHCVGCRKYEWPNVRLDVNKVLCIVNELKELGCQSIVLSGGEPLMFDNIDMIVKVIKQECKMKVGILTSGMFPESFKKIKHEQYLNMSPMEAIIKYSDYISFSFDGSTEETFKKCRGVDCIELILDNINKMAEIKNKYNSQVKFRMNMTVSNLNYTEMAEVFMIAEKNHMNECNFFPIHTWDDLKINNVDFRDIINQMRNVMLLEVQSKVKTNIQSFMESINRNKPHVCIMPFIHLVIDSDGSVFSCCRLLDDNGNYENRNTKTILGNINNDNISKILEDGKDIMKRLYYANEKVCWSCDRYNKLNEEYFEWMIDNNKKVFL
jgi:MoaA/NifB/PqqE/SkfB family radical SAM enzyme